MFSTLLALTPEGRALRLPALAGGTAGNSDVLSMTDTILIKGALLRLAGYLCLLGRIVYRALIIALASLPKAAATGISGMLGVVALHLNVVLTAALFLVIHAACYGTVQSRHIYLPP